jgi:hypothetical protein
MFDANSYLHADRCWRPYALLELKPNTVTDEALESWLNDSLMSLALPADFCFKLLTSVRGAAACVPEEAVRARIWVYLPGQYSFVSQSWGFFQTVKNKETQDSPAGSTHEIALYLYVEGVPG